MSKRLFKNSSEDMKLDDDTINVVNNIKNNIELILKSDIPRKEKIDLLIRYAVSPEDVLYPNVKIIDSDGIILDEPVVEYGNQLVIYENKNGTKHYELKQGFLWGRGLLYRELDK